MSVAGWALQGFGDHADVQNVDNNKKDCKTHANINQFPTHFAEAPTSLKRQLTLKEKAEIEEHEKKIKEIKEQHQLLLRHREQIKMFLRRARAAYGRTALCLSGGAMMGNYHFGHVKTLFEQHLLPHIISGTSAGSVVAAFICTRDDEEIKRDLTPEVLAPRLTCFSKPWPDRLRNVYQNGCLFDRNDWLELIEWFTCGKLTFEEAYKKTGRILCVTLSATTKKAPPVLINHISAPNVTIASAVVASAAVPGFIHPVVLQVKGPDGHVKNQGGSKGQTYWDGSIDQDIPTSGLAEMLNCQFFLAAQCNPHIVPFFYNSKGDVGRPSRWTREFREDSWRGGFLLAALEIYLKSDMLAKFHFLNDLDAAIGFTATMMTQIYTGTTTIVPQVSFTDYLKLVSNPTLKDMKKWIQVGSVAAYQHCAMMRLHYSICRSLDESLALLEEDDKSMLKKPRRRSMLLKTVNKVVGNDDLNLGRMKGYSLNASKFPLDEENSTCSAEMSETGSSSGHDDEHEIGGFDGLDVAYSQLKRTSN